MINIFLDAMGGDHAPDATVQGAIEALRHDQELIVTLAGDLNLIQPLLADAQDVMSRIQLENVTEFITNHDSPAIAIRQKKDSAIVKGMLAVRNKTADGFVSAGSTGAVLVGGMLRLGRIQGIERPALAPLLPNGKGHFLLIDCGANVDCRPEWLVQFGIMGDAYMREVFGLKKPRIGLINNGAEPEKGNALYKEAHSLMLNGPFHFVGNIEGRDVTADIADVVVCDGFDGNLILKFMEGVIGTLFGMIKKEMTADFRSKIGALLSKPAFKRLKLSMDYTEVGGAPLLGVEGAVVKAHGSSNAHAIACAIKQCVNMVRSNLAVTIAEQLKQSLGGN